MGAVGTHHDGDSGASLVRVQNLGRISYSAAYELQRAEHARLLAQRDLAQRDARAVEAPFPLGTIFLVEHVPPVITVTRRPDAPSHVLVSDERLASLGVQRIETDRGGDVTWHGPGQIVAYLVLDLNLVGLRVNGYLRLLEGAVIDTLASFGLSGAREPGATGVWIGGAKVCAFGVRLSRWISMHGLALNVCPDLRQFELIVPCGLYGRAVTSMQRELATAEPTMDMARAVLVRHLVRAVEAAASAKSESAR
jgi:lipoyl(octanoyl) transferase